MDLSVDRGAPSKCRPLSSRSQLWLFTKPFLISSVYVLSLRISQECMDSLTLCCLLHMWAASTRNMLTQPHLQPQDNKSQWPSPIPSPQVHYVHLWSWVLPTVPNQVSPLWGQQQPASPWGLRSPHPYNLPGNWDWGGWVQKGMGAAAGKNSTNSHYSEQKFGTCSSMNISQIDFVPLFNCQSTEMIVFVHFVQFYICLFKERICWPPYGARSPAPGFIFKCCGDYTETWYSKLFISHPIWFLQCQMLCSSL